MFFLPTVFSIKLSIPTWFSVPGIGCATGSEVGAGAWFIPPPPNGSRFILLFGSIVGFVAGVTFWVTFIGVGLITGSPGVFGIGVGDTLMFPTFGIVWGATFWLVLFKVVAPSVVAPKPTCSLFKLFGFCPFILSAPFML